MQRIKDKKGILGSGIVLMVSTVLIVLILLIFALGSGVVRKLDGEKAGVRVYDSSANGLGNVGDYVKDIGSLLKVRTLVNEGKSLDEAIRGAGYIR